MSNNVTQKLWNYCHVLRNDGMSYGDCVEQFTYLLFLKMADERTRPPYLLARDAQVNPVLDEYSLPSLIKINCEELLDPCRHTLTA